MKYTTILINLDKNPERLLFMKEQYEKLGMHFERISATDGKTFDLHEEYDEELFKKNNKGRILTLGEQGCAHSHKRALQSFLQRDLDYALIMEDDIELTDNFKQIFEQELLKRDKNSTSWEYLSFNYPAVGWKSIALWLYLYFHLMKKNKKNISFWIRTPLYAIKFFFISIIYTLEGIREYIYRRIFTHGKASYFFRPLYLAGCYVVTREGAKKIVELNEKLSYAADGVAQTARVKKKLRFYAFVPRAARQKRETFPSTLNSELPYTKIISY